MVLFVDQSEWFLMVPDGRSAERWKGVSKKGLNLNLQVSAPLSRRKEKGKGEVSFHFSGSQNKTV